MSDYRILPTDEPPPGSPEWEARHAEATPDEMAQPPAFRPVIDTNSTVVNEDDDDMDMLEKIATNRRSAPGQAMMSGDKPVWRKYDIDERVVRAMAMSGALNKEIAEFCGCSPEVIARRFRDVLTEGRAARKLRLRQRQFQAAMDGEVAMLIWLGKQELGQVDERTVRVGDLSRFSDDELAQLAQGKIPGKLGAGDAGAETKEDKE